MVHQTEQPVLDNNLDNDDDDDVNNNDVLFSLELILHAPRALTTCDVIRSLLILIIKSLVCNFFFFFLIYFIQNISIYVRMHKNNVHVNYEVQCKRLCNALY